MTVKKRGRGRPKLSDKEKLNRKIAREEVKRNKPIIKQKKSESILSLPLSPGHNLESHLNKQTVYRAQHQSYESSHKITSDPSCNIIVS